MLLLMLLLFVVFCFLHYLLGLFIGRDERLDLDLGCNLSNLFSLLLASEGFGIHDLEYLSQHHSVTGHERAV